MAGGIGEAEGLPDPTDMVQLAHLCQGLFSVVGMQVGAPPVDVHGLCRCKAQQTLHIVSHPGGFCLVAVDAQGVEHDRAGCHQVAHAFGRGGQLLVLGRQVGLGLQQTPPLKYQHAAEQGDGHPECEHGDNPRLVPNPNVMPVKRRCLVVGGHTKLPHALFHGSVVRWYGETVNACGQGGWVLRLERKQRCRYAPTDLTVHMRHRQKRPLGVQPCRRDECITRVLQGVDDGQLSRVELALGHQVFQHACAYKSGIGLARQHRGDDLVNRLRGLHPCEGADVHAGTLQLNRWCHVSPQKMLACDGNATTLQVSQRTQVAALCSADDDAANAVHHLFALAHHHGGQST